MTLAVKKQDDGSGQVRQPGERLLLKPSWGKERPGTHRLVFLEPRFQPLSGWCPLAEGSIITATAGGSPGGFTSSSGHADLGKPRDHSQPQRPSL